MHKHKITFEDFNGTERTMDLYFNLTEAEITKLQKDYIHVGGIDVVMKQAVDSGDTKQILDFFELLVHRSYGIKSADGMTFDKSPEIMARFENSAFYSPLYMSFFEREGAAGSDFIRSVMPTELIRKAEANVRGEGELNQAVAQAAPAMQSNLNVSEAVTRPAPQDHLPKSQPVAPTPVAEPAAPSTEQPW